jgi:small nuclear ribonucleoprotein B and B'
MLSLINWRLKVTINDGRALTGQMLAFDRHMNLVLADCEEFRRVRPKKKPGQTETPPEQEIKRTLGLVILRGETVVSMSVEGPPPVVDDDKKNAVRAFCWSVHNGTLNGPELVASCRSWPWNACWTGHGNDASKCVL